MACLQRSNGHGFDTSSHASHETLASSKRKTPRARGWYLLISWIERDGMTNRPLDLTSDHSRSGMVLASSRKFLRPQSGKTAARIECESSRRSGEIADILDDRSIGTMIGAPVGRAATKRPTSNSVSRHKGRGGQVFPHSVPLSSTMTYSVVLWDHELQCERRQAGMVLILKCCRQEHWRGSVWGMFATFATL